MILTPDDISSFLYCPLLPKGTEVVYKKNTFFESCVGAAIKKAEQNTLLKDSTLNSKKIITAWDSIWWPACPTQGIDFKKAQDLTVKANKYFLDYCKYDISDFLYPTIAVDVEAQISIGSTVLKTHIDMIKVNLNMSDKNIVLIDFSKKQMSTVDIALDPGIRATALSFSRGKNETIIYMIIEVDNKRNKLFITQAVFRPKEIENIRRMIFYVEKAIREGILYGNRWQCKECRQCESFKYLTKNDTRLKQ